MSLQEVSPVKYKLKDEIVIEFRRKELNMSQIAQKLGCSTTYVHNVIHDSRMLTAKQKIFVAFYWGQDFSVDQIEFKLNLPPDAIIHFLKTSGLLDE